MEITDEDIAYQHNMPVPVHQRRCLGTGQHDAGAERLRERIVSGVLVQPERTD